MPNVSEFLNCHQLDQRRIYYMDGLAFPIATQEGAHAPGSQHTAQTSQYVAQET